MKLSDLNERQRLALRWLGQNTDTCPASSRETRWARPDSRVYAFQLHDYLEKNGHGYTGRGDYQSQSKSAANTLVALKRRGLAANTGGGVFVQAEWWITPAGAQLVAEDD
jgi:hypothetical protein